MSELKLTEKQEDLLRGIADNIKDFIKREVKEEVSKKEPLYKTYMERFRNIHGENIVEGVRIKRPNGHILSFSQTKCGDEVSFCLQEETGETLRTLWNGGFEKL